MSASLRRMLLVLLVACTPIFAQRDAEVAPQTTFVAAADEAIRDRHYDGHRGERYRVQTDDPRVDPRAVGKFLEQVESYLDDFWTGKLDLAPAGEPTRVFLFWSYHKLDRLRGGQRRPDAAPPLCSQRYRLDAVALHSDSSQIAGAADQLMHEVAHRWIDERLFNGQAPPLWLSEGLASYFGNTAQTKKAGFRTGMVGGKSVSLFRGSKSSRDPRLRSQIKRMVKRLSSKKEACPTVEEIVGIDDPELFYEDEQELCHYGSAWALTHFLLHGDNGQHAEPFLRYVAEEASGNGDSDRLFERIGLSGDELNRAVLAHAKTLD